MSAKKREHALTRWLRANGAGIDRDAAVAFHQTGSGQSLTFSWSYDGKRCVRLTFSGIKPEERNEAMIAWLNGDFLPKEPA